MNDNERRKHQKFVRVQQFLANRASDFGPGSLVKDLIADLGGVITELDGTLPLRRPVAAAPGKGPLHVQRQEPPCVKALRQSTALRERWMTSRN